VINRNILCYLTFTFRVRPLQGGLPVFVAQGSVVRNALR
jgi:hypothetical protein